MMEGNQASSRFGYSARTAGDVNGDGVDDVIIGAYKYDNGQVDEGAAFVYLGSSDIDPAGWVPNNTPLLLAKTETDAIQLTWGSSCLAGDLDYEVYEGTLGTFDSHAPALCSTGGTTIASLTPGPGSTYYLVVPRNGMREGSYGRDGDGLERPPAAAACLIQEIGSCP